MKTRVYAIDKEGAPNGGDSNGDGNTDSDQDNVPSLPGANQNDYVTVISPEGIMLP